MMFRNREQAARLLARRLAVYKNKHPLVLGIPRGAVPMAKVIADALGGELDIVLVRKLGHPMQPELAIGAIDERGNVFRSAYAPTVEPEYLEAEKRQQLEILRKRRAQYTPVRYPIDARGRIVIVVDDGIATGSTMTVALRAVRVREPKKLVVAVAVASREAVRAISSEADAVVCLRVPTNFCAVGRFFENFSQVTDKDVVEILGKSESKISAVG